MDPSTEDILGKLSENIRAEQARTEAEEATRLELAQRNLLLRRQEQNFWAVLDRYANLGEQVTGLTNILQEQMSLAEIIREWFESFATRIEWIEQRLKRLERRTELVLEIERGRLNRQGENGKANQLAKQLAEIDRDSEIRLQMSRRLAELKLKKAQYGLDTPVHILTEIEQLEQELVEWND